MQQRERVRAIPLARGSRRSRPIVWLEARSSSLSLFSRAIFPQERTAKKRLWDPFFLFFHLLPCSGASPSSLPCPPPHGPRDRVCGPCMCEGGEKESLRARYTHACERGKSCWVGLHVRKIIWRGTNGFLTSFFAAAITGLLSEPMELASKLHCKFMAFIYLHLFERKWYHNISPGKSRSLKS